MDPQQRERLIVTGGIGVVILLVVIILASQGLGRKANLKDQIRLKKQQLTQIKRVAAEYSQLKARTRNLQRRLGDDSPLLSYIENLSRKAGVPDPTLKVMRTSPNDFFEESSVEMKAKKLTLRQVTTLLKMIENSPRYLRVKYFQEKTPYRSPEHIDVTLHISAYTKKPEKKAAEEESIEPTEAETEGEE